MCLLACFSSSGNLANNGSSQTLWLRYYLTAQCANISFWPNNAECDFTRLAHLGKRLVPQLVCGCRHRSSMKLKCSFSPLKSLWNISSRHTCTLHRSAAVLIIRSLLTCISVYPPPETLHWSWFFDSFVSSVESFPISELTKLAKLVNTGTILLFRKSLAKQVHSTYASLSCLGSFFFTFWLQLSQLCEQTPVWTANYRMHGNDQRSIQLEMLIFSITYFWQLLKKTKMIIHIV